jgi:hypothetical protein
MQDEEIANTSSKSAQRAATYTAMLLRPVVVRQYRLRRALLQFVQAVVVRYSSGSAAQAVSEVKGSF